MTKKPGGSESAFYKQTIFSPKEKMAKYTSDKTRKFVHSEIKNAYGILIEYYVKNKKDELIRKIELIDVTNIEIAQNDFESPNIMAKFYADKSNEEKNIHSARLLLKIQKSDLIYINDNPFYYVSKGELVNAKQLELDFDDEVELNELLNKKWRYDEEHAKDIYKILAEAIIKQYNHILPMNIQKAEERKKKILGYFEETDMSYDSFASSVNELLRVSSPSSARSEKLGGRYTTSASKIIENGKYSTTSITGLKFKKPKSLIKFSE